MGLSANTPIRLSALTSRPGAFATRAKTLAATRPSPFGDAAFREMRIVRVNEDHVTAVVDKVTGEYAIGHLPSPVRDMIRAPHTINASLANDQKRTMLGILSEMAIDDLHDEDPWICPVAVNIIRAHAPNAQRTIHAFLSAAAIVSTSRGQEFTLGGESLIYDAADRRLTIEFRGNDWNLSRDTLDVQAFVPQTLCVASAGKPIEILVDHHAFRDVGATITLAKTHSWGTEIQYSAPPTRTRTLPEAAGWKR